MIEGQIRITKEDLAEYSKSAMSNGVARRRIMLEHLRAVMEGIGNDPGEYVLKFEDMGEVYEGVRADGNEIWVWIFGYQIKPIEEGFRSLTGFYNDLSYRAGWDGEKYVDFNNMPESMKVAP